MVMVMWLVGGACIGATGHVVLGVRGLRRRRTWLTCDYYDTIKSVILLTECECVCVCV